MNRDSKDIFLYNSKFSPNNNFNMWFVFPGPESFALSSLGYLWLYKTIDQTDGINVERISEDTKTTRIMRKDLDLIAFSLSFDFDFLKVLEFLDKNKYSYKAKEREESAPLIYAGGPVVTANPEPYKEIFDFFIIGDGENTNIEAVKCCMNNSSKTKKEKLELLSNIEGVYVPSDTERTIKKVTKKLSECIYTPIISEKAFFKNTFIIEVERGCTNRCGFCLASYINLPIRFVPYEEIITTIELGLKHTNKIALLGAQVTSHPDFNKICQYLHNKIKQGEQLEVGVSSLRVDAFTPEIVRFLTDAGQKSLTLAIEAGSERLRKVINKNLTENQILKAIDIAINCGLKGIKFYAMIGLPTETQSDISEILTLSQKIKKQYKGFDISFGFSTFVPKPHTPFQWFGRDNESSLQKKTDFLKKELHKLGIQMSISSSKWDYYQALLSRGDEKLTDYIIKVYNYGGKLGAFKKAAKELQINTDFYATDNYPYNAKLPWDFIDLKPGKDFLIKESQQLLNLN